MKPPLVLKVTRIEWQCVTSLRSERNCSSGIISHLWFGTETTSNQGVKSKTVLEGGVIWEWNVRCCWVRAARGLYDTAAMRTLSGGYSSTFLAALMVFFMSMATVIGPTPPGTGVMKLAFCRTPETKRETLPSGIKRGIKNQGKPILMGSGFMLSLLNALNVN